MKRPILIDANIIIRYLLGDHPTLSAEAKRLFFEAEEGTVRLYVDEVVLAEVVWVLGSFYRVDRKHIVEKLEIILSQDWVVNVRKSLMLEALARFRDSRLSYIDCWIVCVSHHVRADLKTFDKKLHKVVMK